MKMEKAIFNLAVFTLAILYQAAGQKLEPGQVASHTDQKMTSVSGKSFSIADVAGENGVLVIFSANACPFALKWEGRYNELKNWADQHKVGMIVLNSNEKNRSGVDSFEEMKKHAAEKAYNFPYVVDKESLLANGWTAQTTPHAFLLNKDMKLVYKGVIDDNHEDAAEVKNAYLKDAITSLGTGKEITVKETKPVGCSIKRAERKPES
jgi:hypothetical protein